MTNKDYEENQNKNKEFLSLENQTHKIKVRLDNYDSLPCRLNLFLLMTANKEIEKEITEILHEKLYKKYDQLKDKQSKL